MKATTYSKDWKNTSTAKSNEFSEVAKDICKNHKEDDNKSNKVQNFSKSSISNVIVNSVNEMESLEGTCLINGKPVNFLFDTGTVKTIISSKTLDNCRRKNDVIHPISSTQETCNGGLMRVIGSASCYVSKVWKITVLQDIESKIYINGGGNARGGIARYRVVPAHDFSGYETSVLPPKGHKPVKKTQRKVLCGGPPLGITADFAVIPIGENETNEPSIILSPLSPNLSNAPNLLEKDRDDRAYRTYKQKQQQQPQSQQQQQQQPESQQQQQQPQQQQPNTPPIINVYPQIHLTVDAG
ncbi:unnamed protein product, partial [Brachionus calyciflorus]